MTVFFKHEWLMPYSKEVDFRTIHPKAGLKLVGIITRRRNRVKELGKMYRGTREKIAPVHGLLVGNYCDHCDVPLKTWHSTNVSKVDDHN